MIKQPVKFLGAYVTSLNSQIAWGAESSSCSINLVEDPANGIVFNPPKIGTACSFSFGKFKFGGILQRYTYREDVGSGRTYDVVLESPAKVLDGVFVILNTFQGTIYQDVNVDTPYTGETLSYGGKYPTNIINVFAKKENYNFGGLFGKANVNELGYPANNIIADINETIKDGRFGGKIKFGETEYNLDLTELIPAIQTIKDYRIQSDYLDLNSLIRNILDIALYDYIVLLDGDTDSNGVITNNATIKFKTISRREAAAEGLVANEVNSYKSKGVLSQYSLGKENSDATTQKVLLGGPASRTWFAYSPKYVYPIWGSKGIGENTEYYYGQSIYDYSDPNTKIRIVVDGGYEGKFTTVDTDLLEIRCALSGQKTWAVYHALKAIKDGKEPIGVFGVKFTIEDFEKMLSGELGPNDLVNTDPKDSEILGSYFYGNNWVESQQSKLRRVAEARFAAINTVATEFYGKKFLVAMPLENGGKDNNLKWIDGNAEYKKKQYSWEIAQSAWAGDKGRKQIDDIKFYDQTGKIQPVALYENFKNVDYSSMGYEYGRITDPFDGVVARVTLNPDGFDMKFIDDYSFIDINDKKYKDSTGKEIPPLTSLKNQIVFTAVQLNYDVSIYDEITTETNGFMYLSKLILGIGGVSYANMIGFSESDVPIAPAPMIPTYIVIPQVSNRYVWGPWYSVGDNSGKVSITTDPMFSPETFGTIEEMNNQAKTYVDAELSKNYTAESGYVELALDPEFNIGEKFAGNGPYITSLSLSVSPGGVTTTYQFATWTKRGANLAKYNIDRIARNQAKTFEYQKNIRELFRNPVPKGMRELKKFEEAPKLPPVIHGIFGNFMNAAARSINGYDIATGKFPGVNIQGANMGNAMYSMGLDYRESFGSSMDQMYNMAFIFDQRYPQESKDNYNGY